MKIAITGASGFIGSHLVKFFKGSGYDIVSVGRVDFQNVERLKSKLAGVNVLINLAGENILKRWSREYKKLLYSSRIYTTRALVKAMGESKTHPEVFISTSAVGIYKSDGVYDEYSDDLSNTFLSKICQDWEREAKKAEDLGIRTVILRLGVVLSEDGGALLRMLFPFKFGMGVVIGSGEQPISFIHIYDLMNFYLYAIKNDRVSGIYNMTTPEPTTNYHLICAIGKELGKSIIIHLPEIFVKLLFGEGAAVLTEGQRAYPRMVLESGFKFNFKDINSTISDILSKD